MRTINNDAQSGLGILLFVAVAIILALIATWGVFNLNLWASVIGIVGEIAWFFIFWLLLR